MLPERTLAFCFLLAEPAIRSGGVRRLSISGRTRRTRMCSPGRYVPIIGLTRWRPPGLRAGYGNTPNFPALGSGEPIARIAPQKRDARCYRETLVRFLQIFDG
jgi:hypothetical protein